MEKRLSIHNLKQLVKRKPRQSFPPPIDESVASSSSTHDLTPSSSSAWTQDSAQAPHSPPYPIELDVPVMPDESPHIPNEHEYRAFRPMAAMPPMPDIPHPPTRPAVGQTANMPFRPAVPQMANMPARPAVPQMAPPMPPTMPPTVPHGMPTGMPPGTRISSQGLAAHRENERRVAAEREAQAVSDEQLARLKQNASSQNIRRLRYLIREKYRIDVEVWSKRGKQKTMRKYIAEEAERSDQILQEIMFIVNEWEPEHFEPDEWKIAKKIKEAITKPKTEHLLWGDLPPWDPKRLEIPIDNHYGAES